MGCRNGQHGAERPQRSQAIGERRVSVVREKRRNTDRRYGRSEVQADFRKEDAAGGLVWRWKDGDNYYVARANALENNVSLYYTQNGRRNTIKYVNAPVGKNQWHTLRVEFSGKRIKVALDGKVYIELDDEHIVGAGAVGVWTKADSVTSFDDFSYGSAAKL